MSYRIAFAEPVSHDDLPELDSEILSRVREAINVKLKVRPEVFGKPLRHSLRNHKSLRVGDYRIVYRVDGEVVRIIAIVHRRDVYRIAGMRV